MLDKQGSGGTEYPFYNGQGDVYQSLTPAGGYVLAGDISDDFGQHFVAASGTDDLSYKWRASSGYRWDGDGLWNGTINEPLVQVGARYYLPSMGVFITRDKNLGQRPYEYCNADPVNYVDPSGYDGVSKDAHYGAYATWGGVTVGLILATVAGAAALAVVGTTVAAIGAVVVVATGTVLIIVAASEAVYEYFQSQNKIAAAPTYKFTQTDGEPLPILAKGGAPATFGYYYGGGTTPTWTPTPSKPSRSDY